MKNLLTPLCRFLAVCSLTIAALSCSNDDETPAAEITILSTTSGPKLTPVTIAGSNFGTTLANVTVTFNDKPAEVTEVTNAKITALVPDKAGTGKVVVKIGETTLATQPVFVYELSVSTLAGSGAPGHVDGAGAIAKFDAPSGVTADANGNVFVTDFLNCSIRKITAEGVVSSLAGKLPAGYVDAQGELAQFGYPNGVAVDAQGNLFISDEATHTIRKVTPAGDVTTFAGKGLEPGDLNGTGSAARFKNPSGIAIDNQGNLYVADQFNNRIRKITALGVVTTLAGSGEPSFADGTGAAAKFYRPVGVVVDGAGVVYVGDLFNHRIRKITPAGVVSTVAGTGIAGFVDGTKDEARFRYPAGLALGADGTLYVADTENRCIRKIDANGQVSTLAGRSEGFLDGPLSVALFRSPREIDIDATGTLYVADAGDNRIRKID